MSNEVTILLLKKALRREIKSALSETDPGLLARESLRVCQTVSARAVWQNSEAILFYAPIQQEVDIFPLLADALRKGHTACLPRYHPQTDLYEAAIVRNIPTDLVKGPMGVREPRLACPTLPLNRLDFIFVPGVGFDPRGHRLGRGHGYYDRLLGTTGAIRCGVAYEQQIRSEIPVEPHDICVDYVATPQRWIVASPHGRTIKLFRKPNKD